MIQGWATSEKAKGSHTHTWDHATTRESKRDREIETYIYIFI